MRLCLLIGLTLLPGLAYVAAAPPVPRISWGQPWPDEDPELPEGFTDSVVATGITGATALAAAPDGRLFVCEQTGALRVVKDDRLLPEPFVTVAVDSYWERGLIGVTLDPEFPRKPYVYVCYVAKTPDTHHCVSRFTADGDRAEPGSEVVLLEGDDQSKFGGFQPGGHQGGALHFGKDGKLYVAIGDQTAGAPSQRLDALQGKLLRLNPDGSIPEDNPFYRQTHGKYRAIWAFGLRNPFAFAVQPSTGRILINDVGLSRLEEINEGAAGANYGWPEAEGPSSNPKFRNPLFAYDRNVGRSITGGTFYNPPVRQFPERYVGKYFFLDFMDGWMRVLDPDAPAETEPFASGLVGAVDIVTAPDGSLYYLNRRAWTVDPKFRPGTGTLHRIRYGAASGANVPRVTQQPADVVVAEGQPGELRLYAAGGPPLTYRWLHNGQAIPDADGPVLRLPSRSLTDDGTEYHCVVTNAHGRTRSRRAVLYVLPYQAAVQPPALVPGLDYRLYPGGRPAPFDLLDQTPTGMGSVPSLELPGTSAGRGRVVELRGFLRVDTDGVYSFNLASPAPAKLFVGPSEVSDFHCALALQSGFHALRLFVAADGQRPAVRLDYAGPGLERQPIPAARLFRPDPRIAPPPAVVPPREPALALNVPADSARLPPLLSQTGVFRSLRDLTPNPGLIPYEVNAPLWSDGADKRRWVAVPAGRTIGFSPTGSWSFPAGTVFVKHFELPADRTVQTPRRLETRLLVVTGPGGGFGVTYRWRPDESDAELLPGGLTEEVTVASAGGARTVKWTYPGRSDCLACHTANAGFVLGVNARQLNRPCRDTEAAVPDNQLRTWNRLGLFRPAPRDEKVADIPRLVSVTDPSAPLEHRVRSYLDANCAHCHRPGGARGLFDARFETPPGRQHLVNGELAAADLTGLGMKLIAPGDPSRSQVLERMVHRGDGLAMPPVGTHLTDAAAVAAFQEWIGGLPPAPEPKRK